MTATSATDGLETGERASRDVRLAAAVRSLRTRGRTLPLNDLLRVGGPFLMPLGAAVVLLGWYGASQTTHLYFQIPYLISGGLLGLGLMFVGGFAYFARWMTDLLTESRAQSQQAMEMATRTAATLDRIEELLRSGARGGAVTGGAAAAPDEYVATARGRLFHRSDCAMVNGRDVHAVNGTADQLSPCRICLPDLA